MKKEIRAYHHGDLKSSMIHAALGLVRDKGPRGFTLNEASRMAGVSKSAPYNHFKDKDALLIEIVLLGNRTLETELRSAAEKGTTDTEKLLAVFLAYIDFAVGHPELFAVMFQSGMDKTPYPEVRSSAAKAFSVAVELANRLESSEAAADELSLAIWTMAHGFAALSTEGAIVRVGVSPKFSAETLGRRLLHQRPTRIKPVRANQAD